MADDNLPSDLHPALLKVLKTGLKPLAILYSTSITVVTDFESTAKPISKVPTNIFLSSSFVPENRHLREIRIVLEALGARIFEINKISVSKSATELKRGVALLQEPLDLQRGKSFITHLITPDDEAQLPRSLAIESVSPYLAELFRKLAKLSTIASLLSAKNLGRVR